MPASFECKLKQDDILYFLHIPKTAGTTLQFLLDGYFDLASIYQGRIWKNLARKMPEDFSKRKFFRGHFGYSLHRILAKKPVILTVLRDPIERTISDYDHRVRDPDADPAYREIYRNAPPLEEFFQDYEKRKSLENVQTMNIAIDFDF